VASLPFQSDKKQGKEQQMNGQRKGDRAAQTPSARRRSGSPAGGQNGFHLP
jgi:hypothetical protein